MVVLKDHGLTSVVMEATHISVKLGGKMKALLLAISG
jgi:hypothetical protein